MRRKIIRELRDWREYAPAAAWFFLTLAAAVALPVGAALIR